MNVVLIRVQLHHRDNCMSRNKKTHCAARERERALVSACMLALLCLHFNPQVCLHVLWCACPCTTLGMVVCLSLYYSSNGGVPVLVLL